MNIQSALIGLAVGDALGVPVEFKSRHTLHASPIKDMVGYGSHNQPPGTWSDDSSLTFCLAESLCNAYDLHDLSRRFINWYNHAYWTAHNEVFDVGNTTAVAIRRLEQGVSPVLAGDAAVNSNGNGSLMRILPIAFYVKNMPIEKRYSIVADVSALTHAHIRSKLACFVYVEWAIQILNGFSKESAFHQMQKIVLEYLYQNAICTEEEQNHFHQLLTADVETWKNTPESSIKSSGYVIDTLEAATWCLLTTNNYADAVLKAVNLGNDTDTTGAVAGGLAGLIYGMEQIPETWKNTLARKEDILDLANRLYQKLSR